MLVITESRDSPYSHRDLETGPSQPEDEVIELEGRRVHVVTVLGLVLTVEDT